MKIDEFITSFNNHPVLFIGTGISLRYLENTFTWDGLLSYISKELKGTNEFYYDLKYKYRNNGEYDYPKIASELEAEFHKSLQDDRNGRFKHINDIFYENIAKDINISRFKIYITELLKSYSIKTDKKAEVAELQKVRKNIGSIITTNYDTFIEDIFEFKSLIGNEILLSNPYGASYKIHGCVNYPDKIIITDSDYVNFEDKYELIRAQLLSLFIHNPIIFLGYNLGDKNIKSILKTIFTYVEPSSVTAERIRSNFLLVEYEENSENLEVVEHDIDIDGMSTIRINKIKTDNFSEIYRHLGTLSLPVSAMDIRKVQNVVKEIYAGGNIKVSITEDIEGLKNSEKILAIGSTKTIKYEYHTAEEMMMNYFRLIEESNHQLLKLIEKHKIQKNQFFPIFGFSQVQPDISNIDKLKDIQLTKIENLKNAPDVGTNHSNIEEIINDEDISAYKKNIALVKGILTGRIDLEDAEKYLKAYPEKRKTEYKKLLCVYDYQRYYTKK
ncbi:SIR2 family protein [Alkalihalophilus marmarensis]|uniref:SIR2 family protein n=1 Tax=Alkalihalophilus marmarensis TaxID=521377 RepID=UPI002DB75146|nr:SIR2 family protein [Alkalihalophilus marmarensis]MEC2074449.1 SIR2 family protein [Alkalihalophilus marmarensis]